MKLIAFSLLMLIGVSQPFAQKLTKEQFLGSWKVVESHLNPEMDIDLDENGKKMMEQMRAGLVGTGFNFNANGEFTIQFTKTIPEFMKELEFVNNSLWRIEDDSIILIGTEEDNYSLMGIIVVEDYGKKFFTLYDSPFILEVIKQ